MSENSHVQSQSPRDAGRQAKTFAEVSPKGISGWGDTHGYTAVVLTLVSVAVGVFFRFYRLDYQGLWVDEIHTLGPALHAASLSDAFWNYINLAPTPPFYYIFMMLWTDLFGFTEFVVRLPSALLGVATVLVFWTGLRKVFGVPIAATATILMSLSWPAIFYSQEARGYSAVLLFVTWAAVIWMSILQDFQNSSRRDWLILLMASLLAAVTHPFGFIITAFMFGFLFLVSLSRKFFVKRALSLGSILVGCYLVWMALNLLGIQWVLGKETIYAKPGLWFFIHIGAFLFHHPVPALLICVVPLTMGATGYYDRLRSALADHAWHDPAIYLPFILAMPFAFVFSVAQIQPFLYSRYLIVFLPFIYVLYAFVFAQWRWRRPAMQVVVMFVLAVSAAYWVFRDYYEVDKPQTRELAQFVLSKADSSTAIVTGCNPNPPFECALGDGRRTDADWSKYLYYLNYAHLPEMSLIPSVFDDLAGLDHLIIDYRKQGKRQLILMGSRSGVGYVDTAVAHLDLQGIMCRQTRYHLAVAAECALS